MLVEPPPCHAFKLLPVCHPIQQSSSTMSFSHQADSPSNLKQMLYEALAKYKKTGNDLRVHWLADQLKSCTSVDAVLDVLRDQARPFEQSGDQKLMKWIDPLVHILHTFSDAHNVGDGLVLTITNTFHEVNFDVIFQAFSPAKVIITGIGILLHVCVLAIPFVNTPF